MVKKTGYMAGGIWFDTKVSALEFISSGNDPFTGGKIKRMQMGKAHAKSIGKVEWFTPSQAKAKLKKMLG